MKGLKSKIIGYAAKGETIGQYSEITKIMKRKMKKKYNDERQAKVIIPIVSKRQERLARASK